MNEYVTVAILEASSSFDKPYTYIASAELGELQVGQLVSVPFGRGKRIVDAIVMKTGVKPDQNIKYKAVHKSLRGFAIINQSQLALASEIRKRYLCTMGQALKLMVPRQVALTKNLTALAVTLSNSEKASDDLENGRYKNVNDYNVVDLLLDCEIATVQEVMAQCSVSQAVINRMVKNGLLLKTKIDIARKDLIKPPTELEPPQKLTPDQDKVLQILKLAHEKQEHREFLLHGITGSGKTEVYLQIANLVLNAGRSVIFLVPEIALTPLMIGRIVNRFGGKVAVLHSRLSLTERYEEWQKIMRGDVKFVVGARSAIFAPLTNIGLIVVDEEHEPSYKSERQVPYYHALTVARMRATAERALLILGSATPSIDTFYRSTVGFSQRLELPSRVGEAVLPTLRMVDMRGELASGNTTSFSRTLSQEIERNLLRQEQIMLFQNRRGFFQQQICKKCGTIAKCDDCDIPLTLHQQNYGKSAAQLVCHCCGKLSSPLMVCPTCGSNEFARQGVGTEQLTEQYNERFAPARAMRMDLDTTTGKGGHERILEAFGGGFADGKGSCLIGTQMIAKGHDFANVTLVGIMQAHQLRVGGGYNSDERLFQLITQAAGRAGRSTKKGRVIVQTLFPDDPVLQYAMRFDYLGFYQEAINMRQQTFNPPFSHLAEITLVAKEEAKLFDLARVYQREVAACATRIIKNKPELKLEVMPAVPATLARAFGEYRYAILIKSSEAAALLQVVKSIYKLKAPFEYRLLIDTEPI